MSRFPFVRSSSWVRALAVAAAGVFWCAGAANAAVVNGSFETGDLTGWSATPGGVSASVVTQLGSGAGALSASDGQHFALLTTGNTGAAQPATLAQLVVGAAATLTLDANFLTNEFGTAAQYNDTADILLLTSGGTVTLKHFERNQLQNGGGNAPPAPGTVQDQGGFEISTGWKSYTFDLSAYAGQTVTLAFQVTDFADGSVDTALALDNVVLGSADPGPSPVPVPAAALVGPLGAGLAAVARRRYRGR